MWTPPATGSTFTNSTIPALLLLSLGLLHHPTPANAEATGSVSGIVTVVDRNGIELEDRSNIVVFVDGVANSPASISASRAISHKDQRFSPRVLPITAGSAVDFLNDDGIYHNVFSLSKAKTFDLGVYPQGTSKLVEFDQPGLVRIYCNIHPDMISTILVLNNSFFDTTGPDGSYEIDGLPQGNLTLRIWSEFGEELSAPITIGSDVTTQEFVVKKTKNVSAHNNKFGKPYRKKY